MPETARHRDQKRLSLVPLSLLPFLLGLSANPGVPLQHEAQTSAQFSVGTEVINPRLQAFTATSAGFGNTLFSTGSGFEPVIYRNRHTALTDSPDRVEIAPDSLSHWDTLRDGALDGADVHVHRIVNGRFVLVRQDRVAPGGCAIGGWLRLHPEERMLARDQPRFRFRWESYHRRGVPEYFTVRAVGRGGELSPAAAAVTVTPPVQAVPVRNGASTENALLAAPRPKRTSPEADVASPPVPEGLRAELGADGLLTLSWKPATDPDVVGYAVFRADDPPQQLRGHHLRLSRVPSDPAQFIKAGDMVMVSKKFYSASRNRLHTHRVWAAESENQLFMPGLVDFFPDEDGERSWALLPHPANTPVQEPGETYLRLTLGAGKRQAIGAYVYAGSAQDWYEVLEPRPYRMQVWLRHHGNGGSARLVLTGFYGKKPHAIPPVEFRPDGEWRLYTATFTPPVPYSGRDPGQVLLEFSGPGEYDVDNLRVYRADTPYLDLDSSSSEALRQSGVYALRTHGFIKTRRRTYDLEQLTNPGGVISASQRLNTLPQTLSNLRRLGLQPWLQIEPHLTPDEWLGLVEYLAAPCDAAGTRRWACKRAAQGQTQPWTEQFERIYLELGNETWNRLFRPWTFTESTDAATGQRHSAGTVYGMYQEYVLGILRTSPYWHTAKLEQKLKLMLGGHAGSRYGRDAARASPGSDALLIADYNGGWDTGQGFPEETPATYFALLNRISQSSSQQMERHRREVADLNAARAGALRFGTYESGPGYALTGPNGARPGPDQLARQERIMKSLASGTATLDAFLTNAGLGMSTQNFFTFGRGAKWTSHAAWHRGDQAYPAWALLALFNNEAAGGDLLATRTLAVPRADLASNGEQAALAGAPLIAVHALRRGDRLAVFVISRRVPGFPEPAHDGHTPVRIDLPIKSAHRVTLHRMTGHHDAHNVDSESVKVERLELPAGNFGSSFTVDEATGGSVLGMPPASAYLYVFEGLEF